MKKTSLTVCAAVALMAAAAVAAPSAEPDWYRLRDGAPNICADLVHECEMTVVISPGLGGEIADIRSSDLRVREFVVFLRME